MQQLFDLKPFYDETELGDEHAMKKSAAVERFQATPDIGDEQFLSPYISQLKLVRSITYPAQ